MSDFVKFVLFLKIIGAWISPSTVTDETRRAARYFATFVMAIAAGFVIWGTWLCFETAVARKDQVNRSVEAIANVTPATTLHDEHFDNVSRVKIAGIVQLHAARVVTFTNGDESIYPELIAPITNEGWQPGDPVNTFIRFKRTSFDPQMNKFGTTDAEMQIVAALGISADAPYQWKKRIIEDLPKPEVATYAIEEAVYDKKDFFLRWNYDVLTPIRAAGFNVGEDVQLVELTKLDISDRMLWLRRLHFRFGYDAFNMFAIALTILLLMTFCRYRVREQ
ncbi:hypothetical protein [Parasulfitobacter algicola]|uniref:MacB-like periplasmic core domain-containing protein n=1 Tax=Parasulfitobacter algicola TaxID=2614809 RepID=A0ABX2ITF8_9RHOB|nr:hypothetical protein [Sulfitobacter algicola]NSX56202.1 hypothetical protein [Sulfitobacter algicola]